MKAAVLQSPGEICLVDAPEPAPGRNQALIKLEGCGVCASNLSAWQGQPWFTYPMAPGALGHEGWGRVVDVGADVAAIKPGDRVALLSDHAYAEYDVADQGSVAVLGEALAERPFPGEPLGCALNVFRRSGIRPGDTVAIVGIGFMGSVLTSLAAGAGARVLAIGRRSFALETATRMGAARAIAMDDHWKVIEQVKQLTGGALCRIVIEAAGQQWPLDLAGELTADGGRLVVAGYHQDGPRQVNMQMWNWKGIDVINAHERDEKVRIAGVRAAIDAVASGAIDPDPLYTHRYSLDNLSCALDETRDRPDRFMKALIVFGEPPA